MLSSRRTLLAVVLAVFAASMAFAAAASAAPNEVAYVCEFDICLLDPDNPGAAATNLTDNGSTSYDQRPAWSPNGSRLAFVSNFSNGTQNIFVMDPGADGQSINIATQATHYTVNSAVITDLSWSPDGSRIAFTRGTSAGNNGVFVVAANGTSAEAQTIAAAGQGEHPTWSPDGTRIAYGRSSNQRIFVASSIGGAGAELANGVGHSPTWSPDGSKLAVDTINSASYVDLHIINADGSGGPAVVPDGFTEWTDAAWSATGSRIAYLRRDSMGFDHVWVVNADASGDHAVENLQGLNIAHNPGPSWSPDGSRLVFETVDLHDQSTSADDEHELYVGNADGSGSVHSLTSNLKNYEPAWRPNPVLAPPPVSPVTLPPLPGPVVKPKLVWITKRIPWSPGRPIFVLSVGCGGPVCNANATGSAKYSAPAGLLAPAPTAAASGKPKKPPKPKTVVVGTGKVTIPGGQTRPLMMKLNGKGASLLKRSGHLDIAVTVTITTPGAPTTTAKKTIHVFYAKPAKKHKHR